MVGGFVQPYGTFSGLYCSHVVIKDGKFALVLTLGLGVLGERCYTQKVKLIYCFCLNSTQVGLCR